MLVDEEAGGKSVKGNHTGTAIPHADSQKHPRSPKYVAHVWAHSTYMMAGFLGMAPATLLSAGWSLTVERPHDDENDRDADHDRGENEWTDNMKCGLIWARENAGCGSNGGSRLFCAMHAIWHRVSVVRTFQCLVI